MPEESCLPPPPHDETLEQVRNVFRYNIEAYEALFSPRESEKQNGLYVWLAIAESKAAGLPIPDWCMEYLTASASDIFWLWQKTLLTKPQTKDEGPDLTISDDAASKRITEILKLSYKGWNAFQQAKADTAKTEDAGLWIAADVHKGTPLEPVINHRKVLDWIKNRREFRELFTDTHTRRHINKGKKLLPKSFLSRMFPAKPKPR